MKSKDKINKNKKQNENHNNKDKTQKNKTYSKTKDEEKIEEENINKTPEIQNKRNIERFIYITNYSEINSVKIINQLFEDINSSAFNLSTKNDIISKTLSEEEQNNNEIDYISGFQILDNKLRITIIEGITGKSMEKVKNSLPKTQMNSEDFKIFSDKNILYDKRIYSKFNLLLKFIKLRKYLRDILTTFEIYMHANKYRNIYDTFMNLGTILRADTMIDISSSNSFPNVEKLLELERKYGEILNEEDLTGVKKIKKYDNFKNLLTSFNESSNTNINTNLNNILKSNIKTNLVKSMKLMPIKKNVKFILDNNEKEEKNEQNSFNILKKINENSNENCINLDKNNKRYLTLDVNEDNNNPGNIKNKGIISTNIITDANNFIKFNTPNKKNQFENNYRYNTIENDHLNTENANSRKIILSMQPKVDAKNIIFMNILKKRENKRISPIEIFNRNKKYLNKMIKKKSYGRFCQPFKGEYNNKKEILFGPSKNNHYVELANKMREKYINDKKHYYSYSEKALTLSFPMIEGFRNEDYLNYIDNKSKWISEKDFDRYKQPEREKIFFPRIIKEI